MTTKQGEIRVDLIPLAIHVETRETRIDAKSTWIWQSPDNPSKIETHDPMDRVGGPYRIHSFVDDAHGFGQRWFLFSVQDCAFPIVDLVRGDSWEEAYESYIDFAGEHRHCRIDASELPDYLDDKGEFTGTYDSQGNPVDTDNINGSEVKLVRIDVAETV